MTEPLWRPSAGAIEKANMTALLRVVRDRWKVDIEGYPALYEWSIENPAAFWQTVWQFAGVIASRTWDDVVVDFDRMPGARWFPGARLNYAENLLRFRDDRRAALVFWNERGFQRAVTYAELNAQVSQVAAALRAWGVQAGDRVAAFVPNLPETVVAMLAAASLGATWSSCSPDFGVQGILDRFGQIEPKILFAADGYIYDGREFDSLERVRAVAKQLPTLERIVIIPYVRESPDLTGFDRARLWSDLVGASSPGETAFAQLPFDHPLYILYSSGTTGPPKCIVHAAGGILLQHLKEHLLHCDLKRDDRLFFFTTCGWMMWNWLVSGLAAGCELMLYDGSPVSPRPEILFDMAQSERMTVFGTSARYLSSIAKLGLEPRVTHDLSSLRAILSTGSPLSGESFDYVYENIKQDVCLASISGGTDLCSCFALGNPIAPVYRGELQTRGLGMRVLVYDEAGRPIVGEKGELVCTAPFPSMPVGFWRDPEGSAYRRAYFERFPGVWHHGDFAELTEHDGLVIYGRSDAVLNPGGVRIGTAEIYRQVEQIGEVLESVVVAQDWQNDVRVVLFVKLRPNVALDELLVKRIKDQIRRNATPRHVPAKIVAVADIPRTKSGKIVELAVRDMIHGRPVKNQEALANPESLALFRNLSELA
ncbi:MAG TPA: acetoacetate--CoA ligase [Planctomycetaceae bacterium]|nr:acetoacetate--CoA ligase [Planctomycetaceae bacterium]